MPHDLFLQGRPLGTPDLAQIQRGLAAHPSWHRTRLSRELCVLWNWPNEAGQLKDMACRSLLLKLQARGWIALPPRQRPAVNGQRNRPGVGGPMTRPRSRPSWRRCGPCGWNLSGLPARIWGYSKGCCSSNIIAVRGLRLRRDSELVEGDFCQEAGQVTCFKFGPDRKFVPLWREVWKSGTNGFERISSEPQNQSQPGSAAKQKIPLSHLLGVNGCTKLWPPFE